MKTISQRELRNDNARIMSDVEDGESYTVTRRGVPVARLIPLDDGADLRCVRPARRRLEFARIRRVAAAIPTATILDDLRGER